MKLSELFNNAGFWNKEGQFNPAILDYAAKAEQPFERRRATRLMVRRLKEEINEYFEQQKEYIEKHQKTEKGIGPLDGPIFTAFLDWRNTAMDTPIASLIEPCILGSEIAVGNALYDEGLIKLGLMVDVE